MSRGAYAADPGGYPMAKMRAVAGLTTGQRAVLTATREKGGGTVAEVADRAGYSASYTAAALAVLLDAGLVERVGERLGGGRPAVVWQAVVWRVA